MHIYNNLVLRIRSISGKYEINLNGIGNYKKGIFSATKSIFERTMEKIRKDHKISINISNENKKYEEGKFIISTDLEVP